MLTTGPLGADYFVLPTESRSDTVEVRQRCLRSLLEEERFDPTHVKMDIEAAEFEVIESSLQLLAVRRPVLFLNSMELRWRKGEKTPLQYCRCFGMPDTPASVLRPARCQWQGSEMEEQLSNSVPVMEGDMIEAK
jgi:hypothetical protein